MMHFKTEQPITELCVLLLKLKMTPEVKLTGDWSHMTSHDIMYVVFMMSYS